MNSNILNAVNTINNVDGVLNAYNNYHANESLKDLLEKIDTAIGRLSTELSKCLCDILKLNEQERENPHVYVESVYDTYGTGISISWIGSINEENKCEFANTFREIQTLNFMDFYQRNNNNEWIQELIKKFTNNFNEQIKDIIYSPIEQDDDINIKEILTTLGLDKNNFEIMVSRQVIKQTIKTLEDSLSNTSEFKNNPEKLELFVKDNKKINCPLVVDKITIYPRIYN